MLLSIAAYAIPYVIAGVYIVYKLRGERMSGDSLASNHKIELPQKLKKFDLVYFK